MSGSHSLLPLSSQMYTSMSENSVLDQKIIFQIVFAPWREKFSELKFSVLDRFFDFKIVFVFSCEKFRTLSSRSSFQNRNRICSIARKNFYGYHNSITYLNAKQHKNFCWMIIILICRMTGRIGVLSSPVDHRRRSLKFIAVLGLSLC